MESAPSTSRVPSKDIANPMPAEGKTTGKRTTSARVYKSVGKAPRGKKASFTRKKKLTAAQLRKELATAPEEFWKPRRAGPDVNSFALRPNKRPVTSFGLTNLAIPQRPSDEQFVDDGWTQLPFAGITDDQINQYLKKIGFVDCKEIDGYACEKGNVIVLKAGYFRMHITAPTDKKEGHHFPSSMGVEDWKWLNLQRQKQGKIIFIFCSREFTKPSFSKDTGRNNLVPTEGYIQHKASKTRVRKDKNDKVGRMEVRPTHMALVSIRGTLFRLHDVNKFEGMILKDNRFVPEFYNFMEKVAIPKIYRKFNLYWEDVMLRYDVDECYFSMGVDNSCCLFLLFLVESTAEGGIIYDVNHSPALAQLYRDKVLHHVGGMTDFPTFERQNPDWKTLNERFVFERLLTDLKNGRLMLPSELASTKDEILHMMRYMN